MVVAGLGGYHLRQFRHHLHEELRMVYLTFAVLPWLDYSTLSVSRSRLPSPHLHLDMGMPLRRGFRNFISWYLYSTPPTYTLHRASPPRTYGCNFLQGEIFLVTW